MDLIEQRSLGNARYLAISAPTATHRLILPRGDPQGLLCCTVEPDAFASLRLAATARLLEHLGLTIGSNITDVLRPTPFQQRRLTLLLAILDRLDADNGPPATIRSIAVELVYRHMGGQSAALWKGSSQRRQTQRLLAEARVLMDRGYRALLLGKLLKYRD